MEDAKKLIENGSRLVRYDDLLIDIENFNHPGNMLIMNPFVNKIDLNIKEMFKKYLHSDYA